LLPMRNWCSGIQERVCTCSLLQAALPSQDTALLGTLPTLYARFTNHAHAASSYACCHVSLMFRHSGTCLHMQLVAGSTAQPGISSSGHTAHAVCTVPRRSEKCQGRKQESSPRWISDVHTEMKRMHFDKRYSSGSLVLILKWQDCHIGPYFLKRLHYQHM